MAAVALVSSIIGLPQRLRNRKANPGGLGRMATGSTHSSWFGLSTGPITKCRPDEALRLAVGLMPSAVARPRPGFAQNGKEWRFNAFYEAHSLKNSPLE